MAQLGLTELSEAVFNKTRNRLSRGLPNFGHDLTEIRKRINYNVHVEHLCTYPAFSSCESCRQPGVRDQPLSMSAPYAHQVDPLQR